MSSKKAIYPEEKLQTSDANLINGLTFVGKTLNIREWTGNFAEEQHKRQYPYIPQKKSKFSKAFAEQLGNFKLTLKQCLLCLKQKPNNQFYYMCKCRHQYCYNCLNTYAISRIEDSTPVVCPQEDCHETMPLTSQVYKYLPDEVKIKFLNNKHVWKSKVNQLCQRCLDPKHPGQCRYSLKPSLINTAYNYRGCPKCKTQINITEGKKIVKCSKCGTVLCYLCGNDQWGSEKTFREKHVCGKRDHIVQLQSEIDEGSRGSCANCVGCCACDNHCCECNCCQCDCCRKCDNDVCCEMCFYCNCDSLGPLCILWNILSIPIRLILTAFSLIILSFLIILVIFILVGWIVICLIGGMTVEACHTIQQLQCPRQFFAILFYPFVGLALWFFLMKQTAKQPFSAVAALCSSYVELLGAIWIELSPYNCIS